MNNFKLSPTQKQQSCLNQRTNLNLRKIKINLQRQLKENQSKDILIKRKFRSSFLKN